MQIFPCSEQKNTYADVGDRESSQAGAGPPRAARGPREDFLKRAPGPFVPHISLPSRLGSLFTGQVRSCANTRPPVFTEQPPRQLRVKAFTRVVLVLFSPFARGVLCFPRGPFVNVYYGVSSHLALTHSLIVPPSSVFFSFRCFIYICSDESLAHQMESPFKLFPNISP